jgi:hypothetical protein
MERIIDANKLPRIEERYDIINSYLLYSPGDMEIYNTSMREREGYL